MLATLSAHLDINDGVDRPLSYLDTTEVQHIDIHGSSFNVSLASSVPPKPTCEASYATPTSHGLPAASTPPPAAISNPNIHSHTNADPASRMSPRTAAQRRHPTGSAIVWNPVAVKRLFDTLHERRASRESSAAQMESGIASRRRDANLLQSSALPEAMERWQDDYETLVSLLGDDEPARTEDCRVKTCPIWLRTWLITGSEEVNPVAPVVPPSSDALLTGSPSRAVRALQPLLTNFGTLRQGLDMFEAAERLKRDVGYELERQKLHTSTLDDHLVMAQNANSMAREQIDRLTRKQAGLDDDIVATASRMNTGCEEMSTGGVATKAVADQMVSTLEEHLTASVENLRARSDNVSRVVAERFGLLQRCLATQTEAEKRCLTQVAQRELHCLHLRWDLVATGEPIAREAILLECQAGTKHLFEAMIAAAAAAHMNGWSIQCKEKEREIHQLEAEFCDNGVSESNASADAMTLQQRVDALRLQRASLTAMLTTHNKDIDATEARIHELQEEHDLPISALLSAPSDAEQARRVVREMEALCDRKRQEMESLSAEGDERDIVSRVVCGVASASGETPLSATEAIALLQQRDLVTTEERCADTFTDLEAYTTLHRQILFLSSEVARVHEQASHHAEYASLGTFRTLADEVAAERRRFEELDAENKSLSASLEARKVQIREIDGLRTSLMAEESRMQSSVDEIRSQLLDAEEHATRLRQQRSMCESHRASTLVALRALKDEQQMRYVRRMTLLERIGAHQERTETPSTSVVTITHETALSHRPRKQQGWRNWIETFVRRGRDGTTDASAV